MRLERLNNYQTIYKDKLISDLFGEAMFAPTTGRIKSTAEAIYRKQQAIFYKLYDEKSDLIGILGITIVSKGHIRINHITIENSKRLKGYGKAAINALEDEFEIMKMEVIVNYSQTRFFKKIGFTMNDEDDQGIDLYTMTKSL